MHHNITYKRRCSEPHILLLTYLINTNSFFTALSNSPINITLKFTAAMMAVSVENYTMWL